MLWSSMSNEDIEYDVYIVTSTRQEIYAVTSIHSNMYIY